MPVQIGAKPDSGFDDPIGMLKDCHRRIERFADVLNRVAQQAHGRALRDDERDAVRMALRYFRESGPRHNMDEEESLFPRLQQDGAVRQQVERLESEHETSDALHDQVAQLFEAWIVNNGVDSEQQDRLHTVTRQLCDLYQEHIQVEENLVFPYASGSLPPEEIAAIGSEFRQRRL